MSAVRSFAAIAGRVRRLARSPLAHFVVLGGLLLAARDLTTSREPARRAVRDPIVVSHEQVRTLAEGFAERWGHAPDDAQRRALVEQAVQEEMLFREARVLALGLGDASVRRRLIEKMRLVGERPGRDEDELVREAISLGLDDDVVIRRLLVEKMRLVLKQQADAVPVSDRELAEHLERRRDELLLPERIGLTQVFLSEERHGAALAAEAVRILERLRSSGAPAARPEDLSDPFPLGTRLRAYTRSQLVGRLGKGFADAVAALEPGVWSGPIASPYGLHLVRVEERQPPRLPSVDEVRPALTRAVLRERAAQGLARGLARLRELYAVRVEEGAQQAAGLASAQSES